MEGVVQGVGFRPFVYTLATGLGLTGLVGNDLDGVFVEVEGPPAAVSEFLTRLERDAPPAGPDRAGHHAGPRARRSASFAIAASGSDGPRRTLVSADTATCADCLRELADPADRRFGYPFINCTNCGPRFTIVRDVPYDRPLTTMAGFAMCERCAAEYHDPADRRFHAQPTCCPACGPRLTLRDPAGNALTGELLAGAADLLAHGRVLAIKGLGGYHLAADAACEEAVARLRARKHREDKPFAVMAADLAAARRLADIEPAAADLLTSPARPIVLLPRRPEADVAAAHGAGEPPARDHAAVHPAASPADRGSGSVDGADQRKRYRRADRLRRRGGVGAAGRDRRRLPHPRPGHPHQDRRLGRPGLPWPADADPALPRLRPRTRHGGRRVPPPVLACGAELKNTFCLARGRHVFVSHHIGDLENAETLRSFTEGIEHFRRLFDLDPQVVAHDLHPEYLSTKYALEGSSYYRHFYMGLLREDGTPKRAAKYSPISRLSSASANGSISRITGSMPPSNGSSGWGFGICGPGSVGPTASGPMPRLGSTSDARTGAVRRHPDLLLHAGSSRAGAALGPPQCDDEFAEFCVRMIRRYCGAGAGFGPDPALAVTPSP